MKKEIVTLIVPCYNEEECLPFFFEKFIEISCQSAEFIDFEVIFVNDGSKDSTIKLLQNFAQKNESVKYISFSRNFGKEAAMLAGLEHASGDYVIIADADLQHPLDMILEMYTTLKEENYDCVATRRINREGEPPLRSYFSNKFYDIINKMSTTQIVKGSQDFRLMTRRMVDSILELKEYNRFSKGLFSFVGFNTKWIECKNVERFAGETTWSFWSLFKYSLDGIIAFSIVPLHLASIFGVIICFLSIIFAIITAIKTIFWGEPVAGYPTLVCIVAFLCGIQLFCIGVLSEYTARMYSEVKKRPIYIIEEKNFVKNKY